MRRPRVVDHADGVDHGRCGQRHAGGVAGDRHDSEDTPVSLGLASLVSDVETSDANLTYEILTQPAHGTATRRPTRRPPTSTAPTASPTASPTAGPGQLRAPDRRATARSPRASRRCRSPSPRSTTRRSTSCPGPLTVGQDTDTPLTGLSVTDVDAGPDNIELTSRRPRHADLDLTVSGGVSAMHVTGNGTATVVITATLAQINATLAAVNGLVYLPPPATPDRTR